MKPFLYPTGSDTPRAITHERLKTIRSEIRVLDKPKQGGLPDSELIWIERCRDLLHAADVADARVAVLREAAEAVTSYMPSGPTDMKSDEKVATFYRASPIWDRLESLRVALSTDGSEVLGRLRESEQKRDNYRRALQRVWDGFFAERAMEESDAAQLVLEVLTDTRSIPGVLPEEGEKK